MGYILGLDIGVASVGYAIIDENYEYVKPWFKKADLVIGDFEGTISPDHYLAGYPLS